MTNKMELEGGISLNEILMQMLGVPALIFSPESLPSWFA